MRVRKHVRRTCSKPVQRLYSKMVRTKMFEAAKLETVTLGTANPMHLCAPEPHEFLSINSYSCCRPIDVFSVFVAYTIYHVAKNKFIHSPLPSAGATNSALNCGMPPAPPRHFSPHQSINPTSLLSIARATHHKLCSIVGETAVLEAAASA